MISYSKLITFSHIFPNLGEYDGSHWVILDYDKPLSCPQFSTVNLVLIIRELMSS